MFAWFMSIEQWSSMLLSIIPKWILLLWSLLFFRFLAMTETILCVFSKRQIYSNWNGSGNWKCQCNIHIHGQFIKQSIILYTFELISFSTLNAVLHLENYGSCWQLPIRGYTHTTLLLALPAERVRQVWSLQVGSSERNVQVVFVISLDVSVIPSN